MKRSEVNTIISTGIIVAKGKGCYIPPTACVTPEEWEEMDESGRDILRQSGIGADLTDFGKGNFRKCGLLLYTVANPFPGLDTGYCEKVMIVKPGQVTPLHHHILKTEDIFVRNGSNLHIKVYKVKETGVPDMEAPVRVLVNYQWKEYAASDVIILEPGDRATLTPDVMHEFYGDPNIKDLCLVGEVSKANDDTGDNYFADPEVGRFSEIEEDEPIEFYLCNEYPPVAA